MSNTQQIIEIIKPEIMNVTYQIEGLTSYIPGRLDPQVILDWADVKKNKKVGKPTKKQSPEEYAEGLIYYDNEKEVIPSAAFKGACVGAARDVEGMTMTQAKRVLFIRREWIPFEYEAKNLREDIVRLANRARTPDVRYRYEFTTWKCELSIHFDATLISAEQISNLVKRAGLNMGIGQWRPENGGTHGQFDVIGMDIVELV